jgi:hypothetical protein
MKRFARLFVAVLSLAILGLVVTLVPHKDVSAQSPAQVQVVNTPLPVSVSSQVGVQVQNVKPVPVSGRVDVLNTPLPVTISNNNSLAPLFVDPDAPAASQFVQASCGPSANPNTFGVAGCTLYTVPTSYTLVVDHVSVRAIIYTTHPIQFIDIGSEINADPTQVISSSYLVPVKLGTFSAVDYWAAEAQGRLYFGATTEVGCSIQITASGSSGEGIFCTLTGHLVPQS